MSALDWVIGNQGLLLGVAALGLGVLATLPPRVPSRRRRAVAALAVTAGVISAVSLGTGWSPVPKTIGLRLPEIKRDTTLELHANHKLLILFHGWNGDNASTWKEFPRLIREDARLAGYDTLFVEYPTFLARNIRIYKLAELLEDELRTVQKVYDKYDSIAVIAHSMGGLVARKMLLLRELSGNSNQPHTIVIEIATPHRGAAIAKLASALGISRGYLDQMIPGSTFLEQLSQDWRRLPRRTPTFCLGGGHDNVVTIASAEADCDASVIYPDAWGHQDLVKPTSHTDRRYATPIAHIPGLPETVTVQR